MRRSLQIAIAMVVVGFNAPAKADIIYNLTFAGGGTGQLDLNFSSIAAAESINYTSIAPYFVSLTANQVDGQSFLINASNLADGYISTGTSGQLYTLTVEEAPPNGVPAGADFLDIYTNSWQIHDTPYDATVASNGLTIGSPSLMVTSSSAVAPEPSTLAMMITGFGGLGFLAWRKRQGSRRRSNLDAAA
jgi:PEP-CTERM motif